MTPEPDDIPDGDADEDLELEPDESVFAAYADELKAAKEAFGG